MPKDTLALTLTDEYLDSVRVDKKKVINNYSLIGVNYGVALCGTYFNPSRFNRATMMCPNYVSVMYTHYEKLFGYIQNFAFHIGLAYTHEGFEFKKDPDTGEYENSYDGICRQVMEVIEMPLMAGFHLDAAPVKFQAAVGVYGGYRLSIERTGPMYNPVVKNANEFYDYEHRFDYGLSGSAGFALMFDPFELHVNALVKWGWQNQYEPDYLSKYYYRFAYPLDITITVGLHFQLNKRTGKTSKMLRKEAYDYVYGKNENSGR